jgi:hypothetical protein
VSVIVEFTASSPDISLVPALERLPAVELELVREVGTDPESPFMFIWVSAPDFEAWERALADDETVTDVQRYTELDGRVLYRVRLTGAADVVAYPMWIELGGFLLSGRWADGRWRIRMRFPDREALAACRDWCTDRNVTFDLQRVYSEDERADLSGPTLTPSQREVLEVAAEMGYFEIPRRVSMAEVAAELGISSQAVSERLRRGHRHLVEECLE